MESVVVSKEKAELPVEVVRNKPARVAIPIRYGLEVMNRLKHVLKTDNEIHVLSHQVGLGMETQILAAVKIVIYVRFLGMNELAYQSFASLDSSTHQHEQKRRPPVALDNSTGNVMSPKTRSCTDDDRHKAGPFGIDAGADSSIVRILVEMHMTCHQGRDGRARCYMHLIVVQYTHALLDPQKRCFHCFCSRLAFGVISVVGTLSRIHKIPKLDFVPKTLRRRIRRPRKA